MLEVSAAREVVLQHAATLLPAMVPLSPAVLGRVLAEEVLADRDSPPFDKSAMDGYAVRSTDATTNAELRIVGEIPAGGSANISIGLGEAVRIFTGAPVPPGADAVVMQEHTTTTGDVVQVTRGISAGRNVIPRGQEMRAGEFVLSSGTVLTPVALGVLATVGRTSASIHPAPRVAVMATGNEIVEPDVVPAPGQIRNSNGPMLAALAARAGAEPRYLGIGRDDETRLSTLIREGLNTADVLLLAGGVSVGKYDLVPDVLSKIGVQVHFHKVRMKPGKPLLFGTVGNKLVFGLPGNPVSALVGFELFVKPALRVLAGHRDPGSFTVRLPLAEPFTATNDRPTFHPAQLDGGQVRPLPWFGSADLRGLLAANALLALPAGEVKFAAGNVVDVVMI